MDSIGVPQPMLFRDNVADRWRKFKQRFELYRLASGAAQKEEAIQVALLLHIMGEEAIEVYNSFTWATATDKNKYDNVMKQFEDFCSPKKNVVLEQFNFNKAVQDGNRDFDHFIIKLRTLADTCEYGTLKENLIHDRIVIGIKDNPT